MYIPSPFVFTKWAIYFHRYLPSSGPQLFEVNVDIILKDIHLLACII
jgi:hypothetical protein